MTSKWCDNCKRIVASSSSVNYCAWCGKDLRNEKVLPKFNTWDERCEIINNILKSKIIVDDKGKIKLF